MAPRRRDRIPGERAVHDPSAAGPAVALQLDLSTQVAARRADAYRAELTAETDPSRRAALLSALAVAQSTLDPDRASATMSTAQQAADTAGTPAARAYAAMGRYGADLSPEALEERTVSAREALDLLALDDCADLRPTLLPTAYFMHLGALMESAAIRDVDAALSPQLHSNDLLTPMLTSRYATWFRCARACLDGALPLAEQQATEGYRMSVDAGDVDATAVWVGQIAVIRWMQGRISEMEPVFLQVRQADPDEPIWAASVAWIWTHQGRAAAARGLVESLPKVSDWPRGRNFLAGAAILAEVAVEVGSDELVAALHQALAPFADRIVPIGLGIACWGTVARPLALLARRQGWLDEGFHRYRQAIDLCSRVGAQAWLAQAQIELAALHLEQGETATAEQLAAEALTAARHLGLRGVEQQGDRLLGTSAARHPGQQTAYQRTLPAHVSLGDPPARSGDGSTAGMTTERALTEPPSAGEGPANGPGTRGTGGPAPDTARSEGAGIPADTASYSLTGVPQDRDVGGEAGIPRITVLGAFTVTDASGQAATWKSRKARTLLKMLLARRGAAMARESAMELLWPGQDPETLKNRFAVAMTTLRKTLDPERVHPPDTFLAADTETVRLRVDRLSVDVENFLTLTQAARAAMSAQIPAAERAEGLRRAIAAYHGTAFADEPYEAWAEQLRRQTHLAFFGLAHALADLAGADGDHFEQAELYRQILAADPYDQAAHDGLIAALTALGASSHLTAAQQERQQMMTELGLADS